MRPNLSERAFIPYGFLDRVQVREAKRALRFSEITADRMSHILGNANIKEADYAYSDYIYNEPGEKLVINEFRERSKGYSLPRAWAMLTYPHLPWRDATVSPLHSIRIRGKIIARDQRQELFFENLMRATESSGPQDILANAATGSGKTVAGIYVGWQLGVRTLCVVDSNKIANGWLKNFRQFFGQGWTDRHVGRVQQDTCEWENKAFSIALVQSLVRRNYGKAFYNAFGCVLYDEIQVFGGPYYSPALYQFPARVKIGFTATNRTGEFGKVIKAHLGKPRIVSKQEILKPDAWLLKNKLAGAFYALNDGVILSTLARLSERNAKLAKLIYTRGWLRRRNVLVLSNRTAQLTHLRDCCMRLGVPDGEMGIHAGKYRTNRYVVYYTLAGSNKRNRLSVEDNYNAARSTINAMKRGQYERVAKFPTALYNRLQNGETVMWSSERENFAPTQADLDNITHSCQIIFATYEIFSKGVDVPRLDMGVEALPSGNVTQPLGRILRIKEGKTKPEWYAIHDMIEIKENDKPFAKTDGMATILNTWLTQKTETRLKALRKAGARIKYQ